MKISVIVCTHNRSHAIGGCLDSIAASLSAAPKVEAEIVIVDNASEDDTPAVIKAWANACAFPVQLLTEPRKGLSVARNCGIRAARGEVLAFTDDDCRLSVEYIRDLMVHDAGDTEPVLRGGRVELGDPADLPLTIKTDPVAERWNIRMHPPKYHNLASSIAGCNMVMRREMLQKLGMFDERFGAGSRLPGGEDTDLIYRAYTAGITIEYVPDMTVLHFHGRKHKADGRKIIRNYMLGTGGLYVKNFYRNPNLCRQLYWDMKLAVKEIVSGKNTFLPEVDFSHKHKVAYCLLGSVRYLSLLLRKT